MQILSKQLIISLTFVLLISSSAESLADDTLTTPLSDEDRSGGFLKVGYGYGAQLNPYMDEDKGAELFINGRYQWESRLFVELATYRVLRDGLNVGYNFYNTEQWNYDITTLAAHGEIRVKVDDQGEQLYKTSNDTQMIGLRATGAFEQTTVQFMLAPISLNNDYDNAIYASAWLDHSFQFKNWQLYGSLGVEYRSADMLDYYYGISEDVATESFAAYSPSSGIDVTAEVGASYPISQNWLFETYYKYTDLSDSITDSPIMQFASALDGRSKNVSEFGILVSYVF